MDHSSPHADVIVVGSGNAAFSAALTAGEAGARVVMLEKGSPDWVGGNSWFTAGAYRLTHDGLDDLRDLIDEVESGVDLPPYSAASYEADMRRVTGGRCDPHLTAIVVSEAREAAAWMKRHGVRWRLMTERQAHKSGGRTRFWGGLAVGTVGGGAGLIEAYIAAARSMGVELRVDSQVVELVKDRDRIAGVRVAGNQLIAAPAVVLASGGFEASRDLREKHLGPDWAIARVRGTPQNTGEGLVAATAVGAQPWGDWERCHAIAWDAGAPAHGDRTISNRYSRQSYPWGIVVNVRGERFVDEGADFRNYTYAKYGAEILKQPEALAFQIFDAKTIGMVSAVDYATAVTSRHEGDTIAQLAHRAGIDQRGLEETVSRYNAAVGPGHFDPSVLDGKGTAGIEPPKTNWAQRLDSPPYVAFAVTCGITFTFGGLRIDDSAAVLATDERPIPGLYAAGETVGGLFYGNYPGGTGLASGTVFGRRAGRSAAIYATAARGE